MIETTYGSGEKITKEMINGSIVAQSFTAEGKKLNSFGVDFGTFGKVNKGNMVFKIFDDKDKCIFKTNVDVSTFKNNEFYEVKTNIKLVRNNKYYLLVYNNGGKAGSSVVAKYSLNKSHTDEKFAINKTPSPNELHCIFKYDGKPKPTTKQKKLGLISIVIPTLNTSKYLKKLLDSITKQTYNYFEVIVVDDCSNPNEKNLISKLVTKYNKLIDIKAHYYSINRGACYSRNKGFSYSNGQYVLFCDSDVILEDNCLEKMITTIQSNECSWVYCDYKLGKTVKKFQEFNDDILKRKNICSTMSLIKSDDFPGFDNKLLRLQDWDLFLSLNKEGFKGKYINNILFYAEDRKDGITNNSISWEEAVKILKDKHGCIK